MAKGICPECEELHGITPTGERQHPTRGTSLWWRVDMHPDKRVESVDGTYPICDGSGKKI